MRAVSFYHKETGRLLGNQMLASDDEVLALNTPADHAAIDGHHDHQSKRVDIATGEVLEYQPPRPSDDHEWNDEAKRWQLNAAAIGKLNRNNSARARIAQLENSQHRLVRECALGNSNSKTKLREIDDEIVSLRSQLQ